jgi:hypothetical protein
MRAWTWPCGNPNITFTIGVSISSTIWSPRLLRQAGTFILTRSNKDSKLKVWGLKLKEKIGKQKAAMAMGRKLAVIMHQMLITGKEFKYEEEQLLDKKPRKVSQKSLKKTVKKAA